MYLSNVDIERALELKHLHILGLKNDTVREAGLDLRVGTLEIQPGGPFALAVTEERVRLPDNVIGFCNLRSTWARRGFFVPPTVVDPGFEGTLVIEIGRLNPEHPWPREGERFLHLVLAYTMSPSSRPYSGKYQGQSGLQRALPDPDVQARR